MKYLKVYTDFVKDMEALGDAERGRLFTAMLMYADTGIEPELKGNERYSWGTAKKNIDSQFKTYAMKSESGKKGADARWNAEMAKMADDASAIADDGEIWQTHQEQEQEQEQEQQKRNNTIPPHNPPKGVAVAVKEAFEEFADGDAELLDALNEFAAMRKKIKAPIATEETVKRLLNKLQTDFPPEQWVAVLHQSVDRCWRGIFPLKDERQVNRTKSSRSTNPFLEMLKEEQACEQF